jgi:hypothetical protein
MLDDIGLGSAIANIIYLILFVSIVVGAWVSIKRKAFLFSVFWISSILNLFFYLHFMGRYVFYPKFFYPIVNKYWPLINFGLFVLVIANYIIDKRRKSL